VVITRSIRVVVDCFDFKPDEGQAKVPKHVAFAFAIFSTPN